MRLLGKFGFFRHVVISLFLSFLMVVALSGNVFAQSLITQSLYGGYIKQLVSLPSGSMATCAFPSGRYKDLDMGGNDKRTIGPGEIRIDEMDVGGKSELTIIGPASVWVDDEFEIGGNAKVFIEGDVRIIGNAEEMEIDGKIAIVIRSGTLYMHFGDEISIGGHTAINRDGDPANLLITSGTDLEIENSAIIFGGIYSADDIDFEDKAKIKGAIGSDNDVDHADKARFFYDAKAGKNVINNGKYSICITMKEGLHDLPVDDKGFYRDVEKEKKEAEKKAKKEAKEKAKKAKKNKK